MADLDFIYRNKNIYLDDYYRLRQAGFPVRPGKLKDGRLYIHVPLGMAEAARNTLRAALTGDQLLAQF